MCPFTLLFLDSTAVRTVFHGLLLEELTTTKRPSSAQFDSVCDRKSTQASLPIRQSTAPVT